MYNKVNNTIMTTCSNTTLKSPPEAKKPLIKGGVVQGIITVKGSIKPTAVAIYPMIEDIIGLNTKGIIIGILNTIGSPKITGSLILKIPGNTESFAISS